MSEFDDLVARDGVLMAGRFGPDGRLADHKGVGLLVEDPRTIEMMSSCCAAIQMMLDTMSVAMSNVSTVSWRPLKSWALSSGVYSFAMHGDRFVLAETEKLGSIDVLLGLLRRGES